MTHFHLDAIGGVLLGLIISPAFRCIDRYVIAFGLREWKPYVRIERKEP